MSMAVCTTFQSVPIHCAIVRPQVRGSELPLTDHARAEQPTQSALVDRSDVHYGRCSRVVGCGLLLDIPQHREKPGNAADYRYFSSHARSIGIPCESGSSQFRSYDDPARGESYVFPDGAQYSTIAKQFESHLCISPLRVPASQIKSSIANTPVPSSERGFVILRYEGKVPAMASCAKCGLKFFTPATFARDAVGAYEYLGQKFDLHVCTGIEDRQP